MKKHQLIEIRLPTSSDPGQYILYLGRGPGNLVFPVDRVVPLRVGGDKEGVYAFAGKIGDETQVEFTPEIPYMLVKRGLVRFLTAKQALKEKKIELVTPEALGAMFGAGSEHGGHHHRSSSDEKKLEDALAKQYL